MLSTINVKCHCMILTYVSFPNWDVLQKRFLPIDMLGTILDPCKGESGIWDHQTWAEVTSVPKICVGTIFVFNLWAMWKKIKVMSHHHSILWAPLYIANSGLAPLSLLVGRIYRGKLLRWVWGSMCRKKLMKWCRFLIEPFGGWCLILPFFFYMDHWIIDCCPWNPWWMKLTINTVLLCSSYT